MSSSMTSTTIHPLGICRKRTPRIMYPSCVQPCTLVSERSTRLVGARDVDPIQGGMVFPTPAKYNVVVQRRNGWAYGPDAGDQSDAHTCICMEALSKQYPSDQRKDHAL